MKSCFPIILWVLFNCLVSRDLCAGVMEGPQAEGAANLLAEVVYQGYDEVVTVFQRPDDLEELERQGLPGRGLSYLAGFHISILWVLKTGGVLAKSDLAKVDLDRCQPIFVQYRLPPVAAPCGPNLPPAYFQSVRRDLGVSLAFIRRAETLMDWNMTMDALAPEARGSAVALFSKLGLSERVNRESFFHFAGGNAIFSLGFKVPLEQVKLNYETAKKRDQVLKVSSLGFKDELPPGFLEDLPELLALAEVFKNRANQPGRDLIEETEKTRRSLKSKFGVRVIDKVKLKIADPQSQAGSVPL